MYKLYFCAWMKSKIWFKLHHNKTFGFETRLDFCSIWRITGAACKSASHSSSSLIINSLAKRGRRILKKEYWCPQRTRAKSDVTSDLTSASKRIFLGSWSLNWVTTPPGNRTQRFLLRLHINSSSGSVQYTLLCYALHITAGTGQYQMTINKMWSM